MEVSSGRRPRAVPVLARYHARLLESAAFAGERLVTGGTSPDRGNITNPLVTALSGGTGLPRLRFAVARRLAVLPCVRFMLALR